MNARINYELRMAELEDVLKAGCISESEFKAQSHEYWLQLAVSRG